MAESTWRDRLLGTRSRLGWWTLPMFVATGLAGAVLSAALSAVYFGQQVDGLRDEVRADRNQLDQAVEDVSNAGQEALALIEDQVSSVQESLTRELPVEDANVVGGVIVRAYPDAAVVQPNSEPNPQPSPASFQGSSGPRVLLVTQEQPAQSEPPGPQLVLGKPVIANGFAAVRTGATTFFVTSYAAVVDADGPRGVVEHIEIATPSGVTKASVHTWDAALDIALIRADVGDIKIAEWQPADEVLSIGQRIFAVGLTPRFGTVQVAAAVLDLDVRIVVTDLVPDTFLAGAPIVNLEGHVVGIVGGNYQPYGAGNGRSDLPIRVLCEGLVRCSVDDEATDGEAEADPAG